MKKLLLFLLLAGWSSTLFAEHISRYDVNITIRQSGELSISETIQYDFDGVSRHGIFRDIPFTVKGSGQAKDIGISGLYVEMDGQRVDWQQRIIKASDAGKMIRLKIGSPSILINGKHTYSIGYQVKRGG